MHLLSPCRLHKMALSLSHGPWDWHVVWAMDNNVPILWPPFQLYHDVRGLSLHFQRGHEVKNSDTLATNSPQQLKGREIFNGALCRHRLMHRSPCISARDKCVWKWWLDTDLGPSVSWKDGDPVSRVCCREPKQQTGWFMATLWASTMITRRCQGAIVGNGLKFRTARVTAGVPLNWSGCFQHMNSSPLGVQHGISVGMSRCCWQTESQTAAEPIAG